MKEEKTEEEISKVSGNSKSKEKNNPERRKKRVYYEVQAGIIAAMYVALTYLSNTMNLAYGPIQFRLSEVLTILPVFTPAAIPGLTIGCVIGNLQSPYGIADIITGSLATLLAAVFTYLFRKVRIKDVPVLSTLPPVIFNGIIVGIEIWYFGDRTPALFFISAAEVAAGEAVMCVIVGIIFYLAIKKTKIFNKKNFGYT